MNYGNIGRVRPGCWNIELNFIHGSFIHNFYAQKQIVNFNVLASVSHRKQKNCIAVRAPQLPKHHHRLGAPAPPPPIKFQSLSNRPNTSPKTAHSRINIVLV